MESNFAIIFMDHNWLLLFKLSPPFRSMNSLNLRGPILDYKQFFDIHAQRLNYIMANQNYLWTGSWCVPPRDVIRNEPIESSNHRLRMTQVHQAILPLGNTASADEHRLAVLEDFIQCWRTYVDMSEETLQNGMTKFKK